MPISPWPGRSVAGAGPDTRVCCLVTGNGLKDIAFFQERTPGPVPVRPALEDVRKALED